MAKDAPKMKGWRPRNKRSGRLRKKRKDTLVGTLQKKYHRRFAGHGQWLLGTLLKKSHKRSLKKALSSRRRRRR